MAHVHREELAGGTEVLTENRSDGDERQPGYCIFGCGFHMVTPIPARSGGVCGNCESAGRLNLPPPPDRPRYAPRTSMWQQRRLQRTAAQFWSYGGEDEHRSPFGEFYRSRPPVRYMLRYLLHC